MNLQKLVRSSSMSQGDLARVFPVGADSFFTHDVQIAVVEDPLEGLADGIALVEPGEMERNRLTEAKSNDFSTIIIAMISNAAFRDIRVVICLSLKVFCLGADEVLELFSEV